MGTAMPVTGPLPQVSMHVIQAKAVGKLETDRFGVIGIGAVVLVPTEPRIITQGRIVHTVLYEDCRIIDAISTVI